MCDGHLEDIPGYEVVGIMSSCTEGFSIDGDLIIEYEGLIP
jgi:hypothetical protein